MCSKIFLCALLLLLELVAAAAAASGDGFVFDGFSGANLTLDGVASIDSDGLLLLTDTTRHDKGHAFYPSPFHLTNATAAQSFSTDFAFAIVNQYPAMSGHGFAFVLSPTKDFSGAFPNQFLGLFNSSTNDKPSDHVFAIEFDTLPDVEFGDINGNHVGVDINSLRSNISLIPGYVSSDGVFHNLTLISGDVMQVWIDYDGAAMELNITMAPINVTKPKIPLSSTKINLSSIILDPMYVGFSSSTGAYRTNHCILGWSFRVGGKAQALDPSRFPPLPQKPNSSEKPKVLALTLGLAAAASLILSSIFIAIGLVLRRRNRFRELVDDWEHEFGPHRFSYKDLVRATKGFSDRNLLGAGGFGRVYRGVLPSSEVEVAVKRVSHESRQGMREFVAEIVSIGDLRHRNLVQLLGYCRRKGELLLVYAFMPNGSLDGHLFSHSKATLDWSQRFQIIRGVASGLLYLHEEWEQVIVHGDIKASNVLLDSDMNARLGDFGLARLYNHDTAPHSTHVVGTMGYIAPELARTGKATTATDVFAFGAFLMEVACGRRPLEPTKEVSEQILVDWVFGKWRRGEILEARDLRLGDDDYVVEELEMVLKLGLLCSHPLPAARPTIRQVVQFLDGDVPLPDLLPGLVTAGGPASILHEGFGKYIMAFPSLLYTT